MEIFKLSKSLGFAEKLTGIKICDLSLLAKWLREKHGILTNPIFSYNDGKWVIHIESIKLAKIDDNSVLISGIDFQPSLFNTYEEALEIGLQEALKLI